MKDVVSVHFHGFLAFLLGSVFVAMHGREVKIFYSPHGSRAHSQLNRIGVIVVSSLAFLLGRDRVYTITSSASDFQGGRVADPRTTETIESPVEKVFLQLARTECIKPVIISGNRTGLDGARFVAQLSAIFNGVVGAPSFQWIGPVDPLAAALLNAASVAMHDEPNAEDRAKRFARAWVFVAPQASRGFPIQLAEAMAAGIPCVAEDTTTHRSLIRHAVNGFLYGSQATAEAYVAELVDNKELRQKLGGAARDSIAFRESQIDFVKTILASYEQRLRLAKTCEKGT